MPLNDHVLLLQLERAVEAVDDEIKGLEFDAFADVDHDHDESYADVNHDHPEYADRHVCENTADEHASRLNDLADRVIALEAGLEDLDRRFRSLLAALRERGTLP